MVQGPCARLGLHERFHVVKEFRQTTLHVGPIDITSCLLSIFLVLFRTCLGTWSKTYWADREKVWFFLNLSFMSVRILSFNAIHPVIKKMFHIGPIATNGAWQKWCILFLDIFQRNLADL
jgi:hypothetical protein